MPKKKTIYLEIEKTIALLKNVNLFILDGFLAAFHNNYNMIYLGPVFYFFVFIIVYPFYSFLSFSVVIVTLLSL